MILPPAGDIAIVIVGALVAGFVNGLTGTGYALMALGFWLQAMSPTTAAPLVALCSVIGHLQAIRSIWHGVRWPRLWPFLAAGIIGVPLGTVMLNHLQVQPLKLGTGIMLILYSAWMGLVPSHCSKSTSNVVAAKSSSGPCLRFCSTKPAGAVLVTSYGEIGLASRI